MTSSHDRDWRVGVCSSIRMLDANLWDEDAVDANVLGMLDTSQLLGCSIQYAQYLLRDAQARPSSSLPGRRG